jgi:DNA-binding transcriptional MerR regulator
MTVSAADTQSYPEIPDKLYFRIGEVSELAGVKPYVLRYWETEFAGIGPKKSGSNHRLYRRKDVELILDIKHLLYEKRYTIEGARKLLLGESRAARAERALAKPVQAANAGAPAVAVAVGGNAVGSPAGNGVVANGVVTNGSGTMALSAAAGNVTATSVATPASASRSRTTAPAAKRSAPADLVSSIRVELVSLLELLK